MRMVVPLGTGEPFASATASVRCTFSPASATTDAGDARTIVAPPVMAVSARLADVIGTSVPINTTPTARRYTTALTTQPPTEREKTPWRQAPGLQEVIDRFESGR